MEDLVDMIEKILEKSNRIQQGFLDRLDGLMLSSLILYIGYIFYV